MLKVKEIRINNLKNPSGVPECPYFSWILESDRKNVMQRAYRLQITEALSGRNCYDSGWVNSAESTYVKAEVSFRSQTKYDVQVQVRDDREESLPSGKSYFVTGILATEEWSADFISAESEKDSGNSKGTYVRKQICAREEIESAYACTTALGLYHFYINGRKVGECCSAD
ncbi:MAG: hypothetical protein J6B06_05680 [Lachnospiraceae bacterium]|nr:hypothetical protein [Lachnospiraceae bacterium]